MIDLFCGAGGVTYGMTQSEHIEVVVAVNHDEDAIMAHKANHPNVVHLMEDIQDVDRIFPHLPKKVDILWASAECTNHSNAKGGISRDADSRSLPEYLPAYIDECDPDFFIVENVREFRNWGPLRAKEDEEGSTKNYCCLKIAHNKKRGRDEPVYMPVKDEMGIYFDEWIQDIVDRGYIYEDADLNAADYSAPTRRIRYFGVFRKPNCHWEWPQPTHSNDPESTGLPKWKSCRDYLDLDKHGNSLFGRSKNLDLATMHRKDVSPKTQARVAYGIGKYCLPSIVGQFKLTADFFIKYYNSKHQVAGTDEPLHTITTKDRMGLIQLEQALGDGMGEMKDVLDGLVQWIDKGQFQEGQTFTPDEPFHTLTTQERIRTVTCSLTDYFRSGQDLHFIANKQTNKYNVSSLDEPMKAIVTKEWSQVVTIVRQFIAKKYSGKHQVQGLDDPFHTVTANSQNHLVTMKPKADGTLSLFPDDPANDAFETQRLKDKAAFFNKYFDWPIALILDVMIDDITLRYISGRELARITGFPEDYYLGTSEKKIKKHIGNAVPKVIPQAMARSIAELNPQLLEIPEDRQGQTKMAIG